MADTPRTGDTPRTDKTPALVDTATEPQFEPQGDKQKPGYVSEPLTTKHDVPDGPTGDTIRTDKKPALVENFYPQPDNDKTPNEIAAERGKKADTKAEPDTKAVNASPHNKSVTPTTRR